MTADSSESEQFSKLEQSIKGVLILQIFVTLVVLLGIVAFGFLVMGDGFVLGKLKAAIFGATLALISTLLTARSMRRSSQATSDTANYSLAPIFSGLLNKLVIVGGGIGFGLIIGLDPIYVVATYLVVQISASARLVLSDN